MIENLITNRFVKKLHQLIYDFLLKLGVITHTSSIYQIKPTLGKSLYIYITIINTNKMKEKNLIIKNQTQGLTSLDK